MVATMSVYFDFGGSNGTPGTEQDVDALGPPRLRFKDADDATIDTNDKLVVPAAGTKYSYWKHIYLYCDAADSHTMNNFAIYSDGANGLGTGVDVKVGLQFPTKTNASSAGYEVADTDDEDLVSDHTGISSVASIFNYTSGEANDLDVTCGESGSAIDAVGETTNYVLTEMEVINTASPGDCPDEDGWFSYDEA